MRMNRTCSFLLFILAITVVSVIAAAKKPTSAVGRFVVKEGPALPRGRASGAGGIVKGRVIVVGGTDWNPERTVKSLLQDSVVYGHGVWRSGPPFPRPITCPMSSHDAKAFYVVGGATVAAAVDRLRFEAGDDPESSTEVYRLTGTDPSSRWEPLKPLPEPIASGAAAMLGRVVYVACGFTDRGVSNHTWALDTSKPGAAWQRRAPLPAPARAFPALVTLGSRLYLFGGLVSWSPYLALRDAYEYDPSSDTWKRLGDLPWPAYALAGTAVGARHILLTEKADASTPGVYSGIWLIDPEDMSVQAVGDLVTPATGAPLLQVNSHEWWLIGGEPDLNKTRTARVSIIEEELIPAP